MHHGVSRRPVFASARSARLGFVSELNDPNESYRLRRTGCRSPRGGDKPSGWRVVPLLVAAVWGVAPAGAADRTQERIEPGVLHLRSLDGYLEFETTAEQVCVRSEDGAGRVNARQVNRSVIRRNLLGLRFSGDIIHPYLVDFSGMRIRRKHICRPARGSE